MNMRWYWAKIAISALVIFGVGFGVMSGIRSAKRTVHRAVESNADLTIPLPFLPFNFTGERLGTFRKVVLHRSTPEHVESVDVTVRLSSGEMLSKLEACSHLTVDDPSRLNERSSFQCVTPDETMESFGSVLVMTQGPDGHWSQAASVPLVLPREVARKIQGKDAQVHASQLEADRFKLLGDSIGILAREFATATNDSIRDAAKEKMDDLQDEMNDLRESIVETAAERAAEQAAAAAEAGVEASGKATEVKVGTVKVTIPARPEAPRAKAKAAPEAPRPPG